MIECSDITFDGGFPCREHGEVWRAKLIVNPNGGMGLTYCALCVETRGIAAAAMTRGSVDLPFRVVSLDYASDDERRRSLPEIPHADKVSILSPRAARRTLSKLRVIK